MLMKKRVLWMLSIVGLISFTLSIWLDFSKGFSSTRTWVFAKRCVPPCLRQETKQLCDPGDTAADRTRAQELSSSHGEIVFCLTP